MSSLTSGQNMYRKSLFNLLKHDTQFCLPNDGEKLFLKHKVNMCK